MTAKFMESAQFEAFTQGLPEAMLLVTHQGRIVAGNVAAARLLNVDEAELDGHELQEWVHEDLDTLSDYLDRWSASEELVEATFWWRLGSNGGIAECLSQGYTAGYTLSMTTFGHQDPYDGMDPDDREAAKAFARALDDFNAEAHGANDEPKHE